MGLSNLLTIKMAKSNFEALDNIKAPGPWCGPVNENYFEFKFEWLRHALAEFMGTAALVFFTTLMITACYVGSGDGPNVVVIGLQFGFTLATIIASIGHISGGHV